ncbi:MAG: hypothetical protein Q8P81_00545 [Nanoarchaeota archaeon]|nr:hypothetical protein [Nanoarchaeota archaeon]
MTDKFKVDEGAVEIKAETLEEIQKFCDFLWEKSREYCEANRERLMSVTDNQFIPFESTLNLLVRYCVLSEIPEEVVLDAVSKVYPYQKHNIEQQMKSEE